MPDKNLTDKEIIKALECCANGKCGGCPLFKEDCGDGIICKNALDLITRQQTENKRLGKEVNLVSIQFQDLQERYEEAQAEIERFRKTEIEIDDFCRRLCRMRMLNGNAIASYEDLQNYIQEEKSEAVKEFQKNLKALYTDEFITDDMHCPVAVIKANIDDIAEEMVGNSDA